MKFTAQSDHLNRALGKLKHVASRDTIPILEHILIEAGEGLRLTANNCVEVMSADIPAAVEAEGNTTASAKRLTAAIKSLPPNSSVSIETGDQLSITCADSFFRIGTLPAEDFPSTPENPKDVRFEIPGTVLEHALSFTAPAVCKEETRPDVCGTYFTAHEGSLRLVGTNFKTLHVIDLDIPIESVSALVSERSCSLARRVFAKSDTIEISLDADRIVFKSGGNWLCSQLIDQIFPKNYDTVIRKDCESSLTVGRRDFLTGINRVLGLAADGDSVYGTSIALRAEDESITLAGMERVTSALVHDRISAKGANGRTDFAFCGRFLRDAATVFQGETLIIHRSKEMEPVRFEDPDAPNEIVVIMPYAMGFPEP